MRLVLFDIDGTLLSASGAGRRALGRALVDVFGTAGPIDTYDFHGGTDPQIVRDLLGAAGLPLPEIVAREALLLPLFHEQAYRFARPAVEGLTVSFASPTVAYENLRIRG